MSQLKKKAPKSCDETTRINTAYCIYRSDVIISIDSVLLVYCSDWKKMVLDTQAL